MLAKDLAAALAEIYGDLHLTLSRIQGKGVFLTLDSLQCSVNIGACISTGVLFLLVQEIGGATIPGAAQLRLAILAVCDFLVTVAGGIVGQIYILAQIFIEIIAHNGDQVTAYVAGCIFQIGVLAVGILAVLHRQTYAVALGDLLANGIKAGITDIAFVAKGAGSGRGKAPVAVAAKAVVKVHQGGVFGQNISAQAVHQHGDGGSGTDDAAVVGVTLPLRNGRGLQQHCGRRYHGLLIVSAGIPPVFVIGVLPGGVQQAQDRHCFRLLHGTQHSLQLECLGSVFAADQQRTVAAAGEGIGIGPAVLLLTVLAGMTVHAFGAGTGDEGAPLTPGDPIGPTVVFLAFAIHPTVILGDVSTAKNLHTGTLGGVSVPGSYQIVKIAGLENRRQPFAAAGLFQAQSAVTDAVGVFQIKKLALLKVLVGGDLQLIADHRNHFRRIVVLKQDHDYSLLFYDHCFHKKI